MISIVLRGGGRLSFLSGQGFTGGSDPESSHPELVSGSDLVPITGGSNNIPLPLGEGGRSQGEGNNLSIPQIIRGAEKAWFFCTLRAGFANAHTAPYRKFGFTLAEVLITLGIIGIVAAMTLPLLVQNYQQMVIKNQFKKVYATMQLAIRKSEADLGYKPECYYWNKTPYGSLICVEYKANGECAKYELSSGGALPPDYNGKFTECSTLKSIMENNLKVVKKCTSNAFKQHCIPDYKGVDTVIKDQSNGEIDDFELNKQTAGCKMWREHNIKTNQEVWNLADGTIILFYSGFQLFAVDVNGMKGPNKWGHDLFPFQLKSSFNLPLKFVGGGCAKIENGGVPTSTMLKTLYAKN